LSNGTVFGAKILKNKVCETEQIEQKTEEIGQNGIY
jgi:hypothetical protein